MPPIEEILLVHHSHTDVGYTHDQPIVWDLYRRFIDRAVELADRDANREGPDAFRWTVEATGPLMRWLDDASDERVDRFERLERAGRIEVSAMLANLTPLYGPAQTIETLRPVRTLRDEYGFSIDHAMNCDVNGQNWPLVDTLLDAGIEGFSMAINEHFGGAPLERPRVFRWEGPTGRSLPTYNGYKYGKAAEIGIGNDAVAFADRYWPLLERRLEEIDYPLSSLMFQSVHPFGDNGPADGELPSFVRAWNDREDVSNGTLPRLRMATLSDWWNVVEESADELPVHRGDWTDYWNFGSASSARETSMNRESRCRLLTADALEAGLDATDGAKSSRPPSRRPETGTRGRAWWNLHLYDEHTWGADTAVRTPESDDTRSQWNHKANYAYTARSLSMLLRRDAVGELARRIPSDEGVLVVNSLPWERTVSGSVADAVVNPRGTPDDETATRHFQDRDVQTNEFLLPPTRVPGFGYEVVPERSLIDGDERSFDDRRVVETDRYRIAFDRERGGIERWYDDELDCEWVDQTDGEAFASFYHERVADTDGDRLRDRLFRFPRESDSPLQYPSGWQTDWKAQRDAETTVERHEVCETPLGVEVRQQLDAPRLDGALELRFRLPSQSDDLVVEANWAMEQDARPEATYLSFPFDLDDPTARVDVGGQAIEPGVDQIPGSCHDYYTVQRWSALTGDDRGMMVGCPLNPMVQLGGFHFADDRDEFTLERALLLGWVTNNYWETNFRAYQPGTVRARYQFRPHEGAFDEAAAHRLGVEAERAEPLVQTLAGETVPDPVLPSTGSLLDLPDPPILVLQVRPDGAAGDIYPLSANSDRDGVLVLLRNASDETRDIRIGSSALTVLAAEEREILGESNREGAIGVDDGAVETELAPRETALFRLDCATSR